MGKVVLAVDMVSIGLVFSDGNINISMREIINKVEEYERKNNRLFGVDIGDYESAILQLTFDLETIIKFNEINKGKSENNEWDCGNYLFRELIPKMLSYNHFYFGHSEKWWVHLKIDSVLTEDDYRYLQSTREVFEIKMEIQNTLIKFFNSIRNERISQDKIKGLMLKLEISEKLMIDLLWSQYDLNHNDFPNSNFKQQVQSLHHYWQMILNDYLLK